MDCHQHVVPCPAQGPGLMFQQSKNKKFNSCLFVYVCLCLCLFVFVYFIFFIPFLLFIYFILVYKHPLLLLNGVLNLAYYTGETMLYKVKRTNMKSKNKTNMK